MQSVSTQLAGLVIGVLEGATSDGRPLVRWAGTERDPLVASVVWMEYSPDWSLCRGLRVVLGFEGGDESRPMLLGLLDPPRTLTKEQSLSNKLNGSMGERLKVLRIESDEELILECGKAKITLRSDGRVSILGSYVVSRSKGVHRIKGGSVQIN